MRTGEDERLSGLRARLAERFAEGFADDMAAEVLAADAVGALYFLATCPAEELPRPLRHKVLWRAAYVLERILFTAPKRFEPFRERFLAGDFAACTDPGARRSFAKMAVHLLDKGLPADAALERIATAAAEWAAAPETKNAVRIWAMEILDRCRKRLAWVDGVREDLLVILADDPSPAIVSRMKKWRAPRRAQP